MIAKPLVPISRKCDIYFRANGAIDIMAGLVRRLGIEAGDVLNVVMIEREMYLYAAYKASENRKHQSQRGNVVYQSKTGFSHCRCHLQQTVRCVTSFTKSKETWLYAEETKDLSPYGIPRVGVTLIYKNNQYNGNKDN